MPFCDLRLWVEPRMPGEVALTMTKIKSVRDGGSGGGGGEGGKKQMGASRSEWTERSVTR